VCVLKERAIDYREDDLRRDALKSVFCINGK